MIFREEDFSEEEFRSVALLIEQRAGDCGRNDDGTFAIKNDCQEDGGGISGNISPFAKSRTPAAKKEKKKGGGGDEGEIKLGNVRRQDVMLRGGKSVAVIDSEAKGRAKADRQRNPMPSGSHPASTADLYDRTLVQRDDPKRPAKITSYDPVFTESDLAQNGMFIAHESVARLLTSRHEDERRAAGGEGPAAVIDTRRDLSSDQFEYVVSAIKQDVDRAYEEGRNPGFYSTDIAECMEVMSGFYPELSNADEAKRRGTTPEDAAFVFTMITAITSNGTDPALNLESADRIYRLYREHGSVRTPDEIMGGERAKEIKSALNRLQDMIDEFGESRVRAALSGVTHASTVTRTMKKLAKSSQEFGGSWSDKGIGSGELADEVVPVAAIFGPKIGSFFANLSGKHQFLTMDRWLMRSVGRVTGELITRSTPEAANKQANAALKAIKSKPRSRDILFGVDKPPLSLTRDDVIKSLELQARTGIVEENGAAYEWAKAAQRAFNKVPRGTRPDGSSYGSYGVDSDPQIHEAHKAGNTLAKSLVHEQQDPRSARARRVIREVFREVAKRVSAEDPAARGKVQVSEVQAILWQYEQNLWKRLGAKTKIEGDSLYSAAAKALKQRRDSGEEIATLRPEKQRRPKSVRSADGAASEAREEFDYQNQSGQDLWDNEFENAGVDFVEFVKELLEGESPSARSFFKSIADQVHSARNEGESSVMLRAGEVRHLLPRIGFDAPIPAELRASLPESLSHARTLIDLHVTKEGANWWRDNGADVEVSLDLDDRTSPQNRAFDAFVRKFFHESRDLPVGSGDGWASSADLIKFDELWEELDSEGVWDEYDSEQIDFRSADCGRDEDGKFGPQNDCASEGGSGASLKDAVVRWKGSTSDIGIHVQDELDGKPIPGSGTGKKLREMAASLLKEVKTNSEPAPTLYRGDDKPPEENSSPLLGWTSNKKVAEHWARVYGGQVYELEGATGLNLKKVVGETFDDGEDEWVVMNTRPKKSSRSTDCGRDDSGKFGPKNDCASSDGYRGGHKAPRSDGYSKSADDVTGAYPDDVYSKDGGRLYGHGDPSIDNESAKIIQSLKGKPDETVRIYRAVPSNVDDMINPGDWVSINETYANQHGESTLGGDYKIVSMTVPARHIFTDGNSIHEWGYDPKPKIKELRSDCEKDEGGRFAKGNDCAAGSGGGAKPSNRWGGDVQKWGGSSETEIWTPDKPLFAGSERLGSITIERPNLVRDFVGDSLKMSISDVVLASGAVIESPERANITQPRVSVRLDDNTNQLTAWWTTKGVATGEGYAPEEKQYASKPGTVVSATEVVRRLSLKSDGVELRMESFFVHPDFQGKGLAVESVSRSMSTPVTKMTMTAARYDSPMPDRRMTGYKVWPKFGYDAPISKVLKTAGTALPKEFSKAKTILDLFAMPGGPEWWADVGRDIELTFDNRPRSRSRDVMLELKDRKRKRSIDVSKQNQIGTDSDYDESLDELWAEIQKKGLSGQSPSEEDWERWEKERTDGSSGEVRSH